MVARRKRRKRSLLRYLWRSDWGWIHCCYPLLPEACEWCQVPTSFVPLLFALFSPPPLYTPLYPPTFSFFSSCSSFSFPSSPPFSLSLIPSLPPYPPLLLSITSLPGTGLVRRKKPKLGGVYGHFFHELPPGVREMIMERVKHNKKRIQKESYLTAEEIAKLKKKTLRREVIPHFSYPTSHNPLTNPLANPLITLSHTPPS